jgi:vacuolar-type H+-ATPase subunit H
MIFLLITLIPDEASTDEYSTDGLYRRPMSKAIDVWAEILKAEDKGEAAIRAAQDQANQLIEQKRKQANDEVERLRAEHTERLSNAKAQSDESVRALKEELQSGQQEKKTKAANEVRVRKDAIVQLLLSTVLNVHLERE